MSSTHAIAISDFSEYRTHPTTWRSPDTSGMRVAEIALPEPAGTDQSVSAGHVLRLILDRVRKATTWQSANEARALVGCGLFEVRDNRNAAFAALWSPLRPDELDFYEYVLTLTSTTDEILSRVVSRDVRGPDASSIRGHLAGALAAQVQAGNADEPEVARLVLNQLSDLAKDDDVRVAISAIEALDRIAPRVPDAVSVLRDVAEEGADESRRLEARAALEDCQELL